MPLQRGRKSTVSATIIPLPGKRHGPPADLTREQADIWRMVAATKPANWFTADSHPLLASYCRHVASINLLAVQINAVERDLNPSDKAVMAQYDHLLKLRGAEIKSLVTLATAMRLTQHSRLKAETAATQANNAGDADKPWQAAAQ